MKDITLIILGAGDSTRFGLAQKKQWLRSGDDPFWLVLARRLASYADFEKIIIVGSEAEIKHMKYFVPRKRWSYKARELKKCSSSCRYALCDEHGRC